jgi:hypothetical protein
MKIKGNIPNFNKFGLAPTLSKKILSKALFDYKTFREKLILSL